MEPVFAPLPRVPDHPALELEVLDRWERERTFERLREQNRGGPRWSLRRRAGDGQQDARRPHGLGPDAEGRLPALQGAARASTSATRTASTARGSGSRSASSASSASTRSGRSRSTGSRSSRASCREVVVWSAAELTRGSHPARPVDGLGQRLLHVQRHEHRVHLAVPEGRARARLALPRPPLDGVVPALRHVDLRARAAGSYVDRGRPVALRPPPAARPAGRVARRLDDDAVDAARPTSPPPSTPTPSTGAARTASGSPRARYPDERSTRRCRGSELVGWRYEGPFDDARRRCAASSTA